MLWLYKEKERAREMRYCYTVFGQHADQFPGKNTRSTIILKHLKLVLKQKSYSSDRATDHHATTSQQLPGSHKSQVTSKHSGLQ